MAKVIVPNQHDRMTEVELDLEKLESTNWCGKHAPVHSVLCVCVNHGCTLYELHDNEIIDMFGVEAIFYCPELGCEYFDWDIKTSHLIATGTGCLYRNLDPYSNMRTVIFELFRNAARLKILFLKQHQLVEKLERSGIFEGGKKI